MFYDFLFVSLSKIFLYSLIVMLITEKAYKGYLFQKYCYADIVHIITILKYKRFVQKSWFRRFQITEAYILTLLTLVVTHLNPFICEQAFFKSSFITSLRGQQTLSSGSSRSSISLTILCSTPHSEEGTSLRLKNNWKCSTFWKTRKSQQCFKKNGLAFRGELEKQVYLSYPRSMVKPTSHYHYFATGIFIKG